MNCYGAVLVAQLGPSEFLVTGVDASIIFHLPGKLPWMRSQIVTAERGTYEDGAWKLPAPLESRRDRQRPVLSSKAAGRAGHDGRFQHPCEWVIPVSTA